MLILRNWLIIACLSFAQIGMSADDSLKSVAAIGVKGHYGFVILHSQDIRPIGQSCPRGVSVDVSWHKLSRNAFNSCLCFPRMGVSTTYWGFDNPEVLGQGVTSVFFLEPFFRISQHAAFSFRSGFGLAYANKPYDEITNPDNLSYSTRLSFALELGANLNYHFSNKYMFALSANYNHISNGGMKEPNKGINYPTFGLGVYYYPEPFQFRKVVREDWRTAGKKRNMFYFWISGTAKQLSGSAQLKRYPVIGVNGRVARQVSRINAINLGLDFLADGAHREEIKRSGESVDYLKAGMLIGNEFLLGKFNFSQQFGIYIYDPYNRDADVYQRYGLDYHISQKLFSGIGLKAHGHVADFLDFRIGVSL